IYDKIILLEDIMGGTKAYSGRGANCESAAGYLDFRGDRVANKKVHLRNLPKLGTIILYNETLRNHDREGNPGKLERGIGKVIEYTSTLIGIQIFVRPDYSQR